MQGRQPARVAQRQPHGAGRRHGVAGQQQLRHQGGGDHEQEQPVHHQEVAQRGAAAPPALHPGEARGEVGVEGEERQVADRHRRAPARGGGAQRTRRGARAPPGVSARRSRARPAPARRTPAGPTCSPPRATRAAGRAGRAAGPRRGWSRAGRSTQASTSTSVAAAKGRAMACACRSAYRYVKAGNSLIGPGSVAGWPMTREAFQYHQSSGISLPGGRGAPRRPRPGCRRRRRTAPRAPRGRRRAACGPGGRPAPGPRRRRPARGTPPASARPGCRPSPARCRSARSARRRARSRGSSS